MMDFIKWFYCIFQSIYRVCYNYISESYKMIKSLLGSAQFGE